MQEGRDTRSWKDEGTRKELQGHARLAAKTSRVSASCCILGSRGI